MSSGITVYACSRSLLESVLRAGLLVLRGVQIREAHRVVGLLADPGGHRVTGVRTSDPGGSSTMPVAANLVVDASGRGSVLPRWLRRIRPAAAPVEETVVASAWRYVSRWFHVPDRAAPDWQCLSVAPVTGGAGGSAMMLRAEGDRWAVVLLAPVGDPLPTDDRAFLDFIGKVGDGKLLAALCGAEPVSPIHRYGASPNRLRHFARVTDWPTGLVALGDAVCALDPYYGLGMTVAARGAALLGVHLDDRRGSQEVGPAFMAALAALNTDAWELATGCGDDGRSLGRDGAHLERLYAAAPSDPAIARALVQVQHLLRPVESLRELMPT